MYHAKILADSFNRHRLVTFELTLPRFILPQFLTHRMISRNVASDRAVPPEKLIAQAKLNPFIPTFNRRVKGMGVGEPLSSEHAAWARDFWLTARNDAVRAAEQLIRLDVDKSRVNRLLEPFLWTTVIATATDWANFFALRTAYEAQPEFQTLAAVMQAAYDQNESWYCPAKAYHIPFVTLEELGPKPDYGYWKQVATGRCARISFLTHDGRCEPTADVGLHNSLLSDHHMSPLEHTARPFTGAEWEIIRLQQDELRFFSAKSHPQMVEVWCRQLEYCGNLHGWKSYRSEIPDEHDYSRLGASSSAVTT